jgi:hypothetical protein
MGWLELAEATTWTGEAKVKPEAGELTVTPVGAGVGVGTGVGVGVGWGVPTVIVTGVLKTAPVESQACTTSKWLPGDTDTGVLICAELARNTLTLSR